MLLIDLIDDYLNLFPILLNIFTQISSDILE